MTIFTRMLWLACSASQLVIVDYQKIIMKPKKSFKNIKNDQSN